MLYRRLQKSHTREDINVKTVFWMPAMKPDCMFILHCLKQCRVGISVILTLSDFHQEKKQMVSLTTKEAYFRKNIWLLEAMILVR